MPNPEWRGKPPPCERGPTVYTVIGPKTGETLDVTILDELIQGEDCHWEVTDRYPNGRSRRCFLDEGQCEGCERGDRKVWIGFLAAYDHTQRQRIVLRVGPEGARQLKGFRQNLGGLRGVRLLISLATAGRTGGLCLTKPEAMPLTPLIPAHRIDQSVCLVLGCNSLSGYRYSPGEVNADNREGTGKGKPPDGQSA